MNRKHGKPGNKEKDFSSKILKILSKHANKAYNYKQIAAKLELDDPTKVLESYFLRSLIESYGSFTPYIILN